MNNEPILLDGLSMDLTIDEILSHTMPPLAPMEDMRLTNKLIKEDCKESIKVAVIDGKYVIVDGHNRYRICKKYKIPFKVEVLPIKSIEEARTWLIENQLGRRNVSDFVKCEHVLPLELSFSASAKQRMYAGKRLISDPTENFQEGKGEVFEELGRLINLSGRNVRKAKWLIENAAERTKQDLRIGAISIHMAYKETKDLLRGDDEDTRRKVFSGERTIQKMVEDRKEEAKRQQQIERKACAGNIEDKEGDADDDDDDVEELYEELSDVDQEQEDEDSSHSTEQCLLFDRQASPVFPGYGLVSEPDPTPEGVRLPAPGPGYDGAPIRTYGGAPEEDLEYRGAAEFQYIRSETKRILGYFTDRMTGIITDISDAAATEDNLNELMSMLDEGFTTLQNKIMEVMRNGQEESE